MGFHNSAREEASQWSARRIPGGLHDTELYWRDRQPWLQERGYMLRPRYHQDWTPSWRGTDKAFFLCEDGLALNHASTLDATRISDGAMVILKKISKSVQPHEVEIAQIFSSPSLRSDPRNHCAPVDDILQDPAEEDSCILIMPFLRSYKDFPFQTIAEVVDFFRQAFEGLQFMHDLKVAHRDINEASLMMDPIALFPEMFHPIDQNMNRSFTRPAEPVKRARCRTRYLYVNFAQARQHEYQVNHSWDAPSGAVGANADTTSATGRHGRLCDAFSADVYCLGSLIRIEFLQKYPRLKFMNQLISEMVQDDPAKRPTMPQVVNRFDSVCRSAASWRFGARLVSREDRVLLRLYQNLKRVCRTSRHIPVCFPAFPAFPEPPNGTEI